MKEEIFTTVDRLHDNTAGISAHFLDGSQQDGAIWTKHVDHELKSHGQLNCWCYNTVLMNVEVLACFAFKLANTVAIRSCNVPFGLMCFQCRSIYFVVFRVKLVETVIQDCEVNLDLLAHPEIGAIPDQRDQMERRVLLETKVCLDQREIQEIREMSVYLV